MDWSKKILEEADKTLNQKVNEMHLTIICQIFVKLTRLMSEGPIEELMMTENAQPAIFLNSIVKLF